MADQKSRGGQKPVNQPPNEPEAHRGTATHGAGARSPHDKRQDQMKNPDDSGRQPTNEQR